ncbi:MAG: glycosyltransferase family 39 protein [Acidobacteria bacterium]|nr:glycosyltransferase family 39 protein [Acidobacteriota bacterium]
MRVPSTTILWALLAFALFFSGLGNIGLIGPDEPRYAAIAREMLRTGDYITPRLFGSPWFEKPPLYYWLAALFFRAGIHEVTARLPSALLAVVFFAPWYWFARRWFGQRTAMMACLLLASTPGWIGFARAAAMDMVFSTTLGAALVFLALWFWEEKSKFLYGFSLLLGVATLAKGPLAVGLAGLVALAYLASFRQWRLLKRALWSPAPALFAAVSLPWYVWCYAQNGYPFIQEFFLRHNWERLTSAPSLGHGQPFWFYIPILAAGIFPWTPLLLLPLAEISRGGLRILSNPQSAFLFYWVALPFAFFSLSQNKLPGYLLPILPPLTLWIASLFEEKTLEANLPGSERTRTAKSVPEAKGTSLPRNLSLWLVGLSALLLLTLPILLEWLPESLATGLRHALADWNPTQVWTQIIGGAIHWGIWVALAGLVLVSLYLLAQRQILEAGLAVLFGAALSVFAITHYLSPSITRIASMRNYAQRIQSLGIPTEQLGVYRIHRNHAFGLNFYLDRSLPHWSPENGPANVSFVITLEEERLAGARSFILFPSPKLRIWALESPPRGVQLHHP